MRSRLVVAGACLMTVVVLSGCGASAVSPDIQTGRADVNAAGDGGSITTSDWTYGLPTEGITWVDSQGSVHDGGRPDCLAPGTSTQVRFAAVDVRVDGSTWRSVVWLSCPAQPTPSEGVGPTPGPTASPPQCADFFTPPPYDALQPVPGISIRVIDQGHFEIVNATTRTYYGGVTSWRTEDNLVCGHGVTGQDSSVGRILPGATVQWLGGSTRDVPMTVEIWASPCGEGCSRPPLGAYVVPVSSVVPVPLAS